VIYIFCGCMYHDDGLIIGKRRDRALFYFMIGQKKEKSTVLSSTMVKFVTGFIWLLHFSFRMDRFHTGHVVIMYQFDFGE